MKGLCLPSPSSEVGGVAERPWLWRCCHLSWNGCAPSRTSIFLVGWRHRSPTTWPTAPGCGWGVCGHDRGVHCCRRRGLGVDESKFPSSSNLTRAHPTRTALVTCCYRNFRWYRSRFRSGEMSLGPVPKRHVSIPVIHSVISSPDCLYACWSFLVVIPCLPWRDRDEGSTFSQYTGVFASSFPYTRPTDTLPVTSHLLVGLPVLMQPLWHRHSLGLLR